MLHSENKSIKGRAKKKNKQLVDRIKRSNFIKNKECSNIGITQYQDQQMQIICITCFN